MKDKKMPRITTRKDPPETRMGLPLWCHHHGVKMNISAFDLTGGLLVISNQVARVIVRKASSVKPGATGWSVEWHVRHGPPFVGLVQGQVQFDDEDLRGAFGLSDQSCHFSIWLIDRYGGDSVAQGKYIRWGNFLNIPCPGTGNDGDPNISIHLDDKIREAVRRLLG